MVQVGSGRFYSDIAGAVISWCDASLVKDVALSVTDRNGNAVRFQGLVRHLDISGRAWMMTNDETARLSGIAVGILVILLPSTVLVS